MVYPFSFRNAAQSNSSYLDQDAAVESSSLAEDYNRPASSDGSR